MNDVSWLWPVPTSSDVLSTVIAMDALKSAGDLAVWPDEQFDDLVRTADSDASKVGSNQIGFNDSFRD